MARIFSRAVAAHVEDRPHVQRADRGVRVPGAARAVLLEHLREAVGVLGEVLERHRAVLDEGHRLAVALHRHHDVEARLAHFPEVASAALASVISTTLPGRPRSPISSTSCFSLRSCSSRSSPANSTSRIASGSPLMKRVDRRRGTPAIVAREVDHGAVDQLDRRRAELDDVLRARPSPCRSVGKWHTPSVLCSRQRRELEVHALEVGERAFASRPAGAPCWRAAGPGDRGCSRRRGAAPSESAPRSRPLRAAYERAQLARRARGSPRAATRSSSHRAEAPALAVGSTRRSRARCAPCCRSAIEREPQELLPAMPPSVACALVETSTGNHRPCGRRCAFS